MVLYNWPRDRSLVYQITLLCSVWCWSFYQIIYMRACRFYSDHPDCQTKDFMGTFYWSIVSSGFLLVPPLVDWF